MECLRRAGERGSSLIQAMVGLALIASSLRLAIPEVQDVVRTSALNAAAEEVFADVRQARAEALTRNRRVTICKSAEGSSCSTAGGWQQGWIIFQDENNNGVRESTEPVIARHAPLALQLRVTGNAPVERYVSYSAIGTTRLTGGGFQAGTLTVCLSSSAPAAARQIVLNAVGRPRVQKATVVSCV
ncbi:GspH/FimT family pseudopilin [Ramlibacter sp.]|uniref:GspH/FimT family pseudopilin n=1 Tax=Ramlibacter sp. TaxID=1917967 RepID=UPI0026122EF3|nr:GspH/FimT family pseudopilin [Ramlibacter sp.]